ncbi:MAG: hypothetical protein Kilf2KO_28360 [Rhodospirillales bacterium]
MIKEKKSYDLYLQVPDEMDQERMMAIVDRAAAASGLYISHLGGYSRVKYPNSLHWHFKRDRKEPGLIDATFWNEGAKFWLMVRHNEPAWVHDTAPRLHAALRRELALLGV